MMEGADIRVVQLGYRPDLLNDPPLCVRVLARPICGLPSRPCQGHSRLTDECFKEYSSSKEATSLGLEIRRTSPFVTSPFNLQLPLAKAGKGPYRFLLKNVPNNSSEVKEKGPRRLAGLWNPFSPSLL